MAKFSNPKQRERHMRIFRSKLSTYDKNHLKKLLDKTWDSWTWDTGSDMDEEKIRLLKQELESRDAWEKEYERRWVDFPIRFEQKGSHQKKRKKRRDWQNRVNRSYERVLKKYGRKSDT